MSVMRWLWGNANRADANIQEFQIRLCDPGLDKYKEDLIVISNRLVSTEKRRGPAATQKCWFAGKLNNSIYVLALGGEQNTLLNARYQGTRGLFCTMAYGFTGEDICLFRRDEAIFQPLMELMRQVNDTGICSTEPFDADMLKKFALEENIGDSDAGTGSYNIMQSSPTVDAVFWQQSMRRPVAIGVISEDDAKRLINHFPQGAVTVLGVVEPQQHRGQETVSPIQQRMNEADRQLQRRDQVQSSQGTDAHRSGANKPERKVYSLTGGNQTLGRTNSGKKVIRGKFTQCVQELTKICRGDPKDSRVQKIMRFFEDTWTPDKEDACNKALSYWEEKEGLNDDQLSRLRDFALLFAYENERCYNDHELVELFRELMKSLGWFH